MSTTARSALVVTVTDTEPLLFVLTGSVVELETVAVLASTVPSARLLFTVPRISIDTLFPFWRVPLRYEPVHGIHADPLSSEYSALTIPDGTASATDTLSASEGPALAMVTAYWMYCPATTGLVLQASAIDRLAIGVTVVLIVEVLFEVTGSATGLLIEAVPGIVPVTPDSTLPLINRLKVAPLERLPTA